MYPSKVSKTHLVSQNFMINNFINNLSHNQKWTDFPRGHWLRTIHTYIQQDGTTWFTYTTNYTVPFFSPGHGILHESVFSLLLHSPVRVPFLVPRPHVVLVKFWQGPQLHSLHRAEQIQISYKFNIDYKVNETMKH